MAIILVGNMGSDPWIRIPACCFSLTQITLNASNFNLVFINSYLILVEQFIFTSSNYNFKLQVQITKFFHHIKQQSICVSSQTLLNI